MENRKYENFEVIGLVVAKSVKSILLREPDGTEYWYDVFDGENPYFKKTTKDQVIKIIYNIKKGSKKTFRNIYRIETVPTEG